jgi:putative oxidoreductase
LFGSLVAFPEAATAGIFHLAGATIARQNPINSGNKSFTSKLSTLSGQKDSPSKFCDWNERKNCMKNLLTWLMNPPPDGPASTLLLRLMAGGVFLWEGVMKFVFVSQGVGRFTKLGMPFPHFTAAFVGCLEIVGGLLLLSGLMTRLIAIPFVIEMIVAILSTKISMFLGRSPLPLPPVPPQVGMWAVLHEVRSEYAQLLTSAFLLINGPGKWSLDALLQRNRSAKPVPSKMRPVYSKLAS